MALEIERRFLVCDPVAAMDAAADTPSYIMQGYFGWINNFRLRIRIMANEQNGVRGFLTFKEARHDLCRQEFEYPMPLKQARRALSALPSAQIIRKWRYDVCHGGRTWSVDRFEGLNSGLILAEIELVCSNEEVELPPWVGEEVTFDFRYRNSQLAFSPLRPFSSEARSSAAHHCSKFGAAFHSWAKVWKSGVNPCQ